MRPEEIAHQAGMIDLILALDGATLTGTVQPEWIDDMLTAWKSELDQQIGHDDPRKFTRDLIYQHLLLNRHKEEDAGEILLCAMVWLAAGNPDGGDTILAHMRAGDVEVRYDIISDDETRERRFRLSVGTF